MTALCCVIEDNVKDYLDARPVQGLDHVAKLSNRGQRVGPELYPWCGAKKETGA